MWLVKLRQNDYVAVAHTAVDLVAPNQVGSQDVDPAMAEAAHTEIEVGCQNYVWGLEQ